MYLMHCKVVMLSLCFLLSHLSSWDIADPFAVSCTTGYPSNLSCFSIEFCALPTPV